MKDKKARPMSEETNNITVELWNIEALEFMGLTLKIQCERCQSNTSIGHVCCCRGFPLPRANEEIQKTNRWECRSELHSLDDVNFENQEQTNAWNQMWWKKTQDHGKTEESHAKEEHKIEDETSQHCVTRDTSTPREDTFTTRADEEANRTTHFSSSNGFNRKLSFKDRPMAMDPNQTVFLSFASRYCTIYTLICITRSIQDEIPAEPESHDVLLDANPEHCVRKQRCARDTCQPDITQTTDKLAEVGKSNGLSRNGHGVESICHSSALRICGVCVSLLFRIACAAQIHRDVFPFLFVHYFGNLFFLQHV